MATALTPQELAAARAYLVAEEDDDAVVTGCVLAARDYLADAGVRLPEGGTGRRAKYDLVCHAMALSSYEQRSPVMAGTVVAENPQLRRMLRQLMMTESSPGPGGGGVADG